MAGKIVYVSTPMGRDPGKAFRRWARLRHDPPDLVIEVPFADLLIRGPETARAFAHLTRHLRPFVGFNPRLERATDGRRS